jgi:L-ornithine Nalpha-acyltransferase
MSNFTIKLAKTKEEREQAFRLRHEIFLKELGGDTTTLSSDGIEKDAYDDTCDHLLVIDNATRAAVGTYRLLSGSKVDPKIGFYAEKIFKIDAIKALGKNIVELGRSCVHKDYREGAIIELLWKGIAEYIQKNNMRYLFGSVRLYTTDPGEISEVFELIKMRYYSKENLRVEPADGSIFKLPNKPSQPIDPKKTFFKLPALLKGYIRLGLKICGPPAWDRHLESVVLFILLDINEITPSYRKHFLGS